MAARPLTRAQIGRKLGVWQERLHLDHWRIAVDWDTFPDNEGVAEVNAQDTPYDRCVVIFHRNATTWPADKWGAAQMVSADYMIAHELLHAVHRDVDRTVHALQFQMHQDAWSVGETNYHNAVERFVDRVAWILLDAHGPA